MRVLIVDDHEVIWSGMRAVIERLAAQHAPGEAFEWHAARDVPAALALEMPPPDLVLLDYHLPGLSGVEAMRALRERHEGSTIVVVSGDVSPARIRATIEAGAAGYIPKTATEHEMIAALALVMAHGIYLPALALMEAEPKPPPGDDALPTEALSAFMSAELSPRQRQAFSCALRGMPNKLIARELGIAEGTVKVHLAMVFRALGVRNRTEAMYRVLSADAAAAVSAR